MKPKWTFNKKNKLTLTKESSKEIDIIYKKIIKIPDLNVLFQLNKKGFVYNFNQLKKGILSDYFISNKKTLDKIRLKHWEHNTTFRLQLISIVKKNSIKNINIDKILISKVSKKCSK